MPYYTQSPLDVGLGAAGAFLSAQQQKKQQDLLNKQAEEQIRQQAALAAAQQATENRRIADEEEAQRFNEAQMKPGSYQTKTTVGTYQQAHPGHPKGSKKVMTGQEYVPGGIDYEYKQAQIRSQQAGAQEKLSQIPLNQAKTYYINTYEGKLAQSKIDDAKNRLKIAQQRLAQGRSSGAAGVALQRLQADVAHWNAEATQRQQDFDIQAQSAAAQEQFKMYSQQYANNPTDQAALAGMTAAIAALANSRNSGQPIIIQPGAGGNYTSTTQQTGPKEGDPAPQGAQPGQSNTFNGKTWYVWGDRKLHSKPEPAKSTTQNDTRNSFMPFNVGPH